MSRQQCSFANSICWILKVVALTAALLVAVVFAQNPVPQRGIATPAFAALGKYHAGTSATEDVFTGRILLNSSVLNNKGNLRRQSPQRYPISRQQRHSVAEGGGVC